MAKPDAVVLSASTADIPEVSRLLADVFSRRDPPAIATRFSAKKLEEVARIFARKAEQEGLLALAKETATGAIVGAVLAHDFGMPPPSEIGKVDLTSEPVIALLDELEEVFVDTHEVAPGKFLHIFMIAVSDDFSGKGIAQQLAQFCLEEASMAGYCTAFTEATNRISQRLFTKIGFREIHFRSYAEFEFEGRKPFSEIRGQRGCALMEMEITSLSQVLNSPASQI